MSTEDDDLDGVAEEDAYAPSPALSTDEDEFSPFDDLGDEYAGEPIQKVLAEDGLPTIAAPEAHSDIPPLSPETLICMGDYSEFMGTLGDGPHALKDVEAVADPERGLIWRVRLTGFEVEPKRRPCIHYVRQLGQLDRAPEHKQLVRLCSARRTTEGAMMSVGDRGIWECDMRTPYVYVGKLDQIDQEKMKAGREPARPLVFQKEKS